MVQKDAEDRIVTNIDFEFLHKETPASKAILLFHGLTGSPFEMRKYGQFFHKNGYDVYCYSLPGHGTHTQAIERATWSDWVVFAQSKYDELRGNYKDFYASGVCLGAVISIYLAQKNPDVDAVVALSTTLFLDGWKMPWYNFMMPLGLNTIVRHYYTFPESEPYGIKNEKVRRTIGKLMGKSKVALDNYPLTCVYELLKLSHTVRSDIKSLKCPILLVHALEDDLTSTRSANFVYNKASSPVKEYIELKDSYHMVLYDNEKDFVFERALEFTSKHSDETKQGEVVA